MHFWAAFSLLMEGVLAGAAAADLFAAGRVPEALRAFQTVSDSNDTCLAATLAMMHAHKQSQTVDRDAIANLEARCSLAPLPSTSSTDINQISF